MISFNNLGNALNSITEISQSASSYAGKIGGIVSGLSGLDSTAAHIRDIYTNGFLSDSTIYIPSKFARAFDEPTYLTFRIEFNFFDPVRNTAYNNNDLSDAGKFYGVMYDYMPEPFLQGYGNINQKSNYDTSTYDDITRGPGDQAMGKSYSTEGYLIHNLGDYGRAQLLKNFKIGLKDIQDNYPYYFNKITGLSSLTKIDPKSGIRVKDGKIEIECYEALDLRITQLLQMYRKIVWDDTYQRWVLPDMMRYFSMRIYISEIRLFHTVKGTLNSSKYKPYDFTGGDMRNATTLPGETWYDKAANITNNILGSSAVLSSNFLGTNSTVTNVLNSVKGVTDTAQSVYGALNKSFTKMCVNAINTVMPTIMIDCHMCEFDISDSMSYIDSLMSSMQGNSAVTPKLCIKVGQATEVHSYPLNEWLYPSGNVYNFYDLQNCTNTIADESFNKHNNSLFDFENRVNGIVSNYIGTESFLVKKFKQTPNSKFDISQLTYTKNQTSTVQSITNLVTSALSALNHYGVIGEHSTAVNVDPNKLQAVVSAAAVLQELANAVNENSNIKSAAVQAANRNAIAANVYASVLDDIISNSVNNAELRNVAIAVREGLNTEYSTEYNSLSIEDLTALKNSATKGFKDYIYDASVYMSGDDSLSKDGYWKTTDGKWTNISAAQNDSNIQSALETVGKAHKDNYVDPRVSEAVEDMETIKNSAKSAFGSLNKSSIHSSAVENMETLKDNVSDIYEEPGQISTAVEDLTELKSGTADTYTIPYDPHSVAVEDLTDIKVNAADIYAVQDIHSSAVENMETLKNNTSDVYEKDTQISEAVEDLEQLKNNAADVYTIPYDPFSTAVEDMETIKNNAADVYAEPEQISTAVEDLSELKSGVSDTYDIPYDPFSTAVEDMEVLKDGATDIYEDSDQISAAVEDMEVLKNNASDIYDIPYDPHSTAVEDMETLKDNAADIYDIPYDPHSTAVEDMEQLKNNASDIYDIPYDPLSTAVQDMETLKDNVADLYEIPYDPLSTAVQDMEPLKDNTSDIYDIPYNPLSVAVQDMEPLKDNAADIYDIPYDPHSTAVEDMESIKNNAADLYEIPYNPFSTAVEDMEPLKNNAADIYDIPYDPLSTAVQDMEPLKDNTSDIYEIPYDPLSTAVQDMEPLKNNTADIYTDDNMISMAVEDMEQLKDNAADLYEIPYDPLSTAVQDMEALKNNSSEIYDEPEQISAAVEDMTNVKASANDIYIEDGQISKAVEDMEQLKNNASDIYTDPEYTSVAVEDLQSLKNNASDVYNPSEYNSVAVEDLTDLKNGALKLYDGSANISEAVEDMEVLKDNQARIYKDASLYYSAAQAINHSVTTEDTIYKENNQTRISRYGSLNKK